MEFEGPQSVRYTGRHSQESSEKTNNKAYSNLVTKVETVSTDSITIQEKPTKRKKELSESDTRVAKKPKNDPIQSIQKIIKVVHEGTTLSLEERRKFFGMRFVIKNQLEHTPENLLFIQQIDETVALINQQHWETNDLQVIDGTLICSEHLQEVLDENSLTMILNGAPRDVLERIVRIGIQGIRISQRLFETLFIHCPNIEASFLEQLGKESYGVSPRDLWMLAASHSPENRAYILQLLYSLEGDTTAIPLEDLKRSIDNMLASSPSISVQIIRTMPNNEKYQMIQKWPSIEQDVREKMAELYDNVFCSLHSHDTPDLVDALIRALSEQDLEKRKEFVGICKQVFKKEYALNLDLEQIESFFDLLITSTEEQKERIKSVVPIILKNNAREENTTTFFQILFMPNSDDKCYDSEKHHMIKILSKIPKKSHKELLQILDEFRSITDIYTAPS